MPNIHVKQGPKKGHRFPLGERPLVVGRDPGEGLTLMDPSSSRRHAEFFCVGSTYSFRDWALEFTTPLLSAMNRKRSRFINDLHRFQNWAIRQEDLSYVKKTRPVRCSRNTRLINSTK